MKRIIALMEQKNHYLEKFVTINENEIERFMENNFDNLETFYNQRESILELIRYIDGQINATQADVESASIEASDRDCIKRLMGVKNQYVSEIMRQDLEVLACIDHAKSGIIRDLQDIKKTKKAVSGYKAPNFTKRLDEEA